MRSRDPRHRGRRYDGAVRRRQFVRWTIGAVRMLAVPVVLMSVLLGVDVVLPGTTEEGIAYRRTLETRWLVPDGYTIGVGWSNRAGCTEQHSEGSRRLLFLDREGCSGSVGVGARFGRALSGSDTLHVVRTPLFERVREVRRPSDGLRDQMYSLLQIGGFVLIGLIPLLSFGRGFAVHPTHEGPNRRYIAYVLPALLAEAVYVALLVQVLSG